MLRLIIMAGLLATASCASKPMTTTVAKDQEGYELPKGFKAVGLRVGRSLAFILCGKDNIGCDMISPSGEHTIIYTSKDVCVHEIEHVCRGPNHVRRRRYD